MSTFSPSALIPVMNMLFAVIATGLLAGCAAAQPRVAPSAPRVPLTDTGQSLAGDYVPTHGKVVDEIAAPYVTEYARVNGIEMHRIIAALFPKPPRAGDTPISISSYRRRTGDWTFFRSASVRIYELMRLRAADSAGSLFLVLYAPSSPGDLILDRFEARWHLALFSSAYALLSNQQFVTRIRHREPGVWDMIYTDMSLSEGSPVVKILYAHTGGGGGRDQEFTARSQVVGPPFRLRKISVAQTVDEY